ncbi:MAG: hypothetical protein H0T46_24355 [Deltaproteobacteria bacterium]|nr:hypothetical protein [Deltaproteobacteria bacterium]
MSALAEVGARLRRAGLTEGALLAWSGTHRLSLLRQRLSGLSARPPVPAAAPLALFVAGAELPADSLRMLEPLDDLLAAGLVERKQHLVRANVAVVPLGNSLLVCDRADAPDSEDHVCWPDDSSYHLASAIGPGRRARWIDLACGSAFAPLARPELAAEIRGVDLNARAVRLAQIGAALTHCRHLSIAEADIGDSHPPAALVTCNAPIPGDPDASIWRRTDHAFFARMWPAARASTAPGGEIITHTTLDAVPSDLAGQVVTVVYTPPGERGYAVTWWVPDAPALRIVAQRALTPARPHLDSQDREDALAGRLVPLDSGAC